MIDQIVQTVRDTPPSKVESGCAARFVPFIDGWGIKFYPDEDTRDSTHTLQDRAYTDGLAPEVGDKFEFNIDGIKRYGYLTKMAKVCKATYAEQWGIPYNKAAWDKRREEAEEEIRKRPEYRQLMEEMEFFVYDTCDMHWGNVGYLPDGRMVAIDFDGC
jgi:hypothetical protein